MQSSALYNDFGSLATLRAEAQHRPQAALEEVAGQFEALFVQMMVKSMREATMRGGLFSSSQLETYEQMYDQQLSMELSGQGGMGLREVLLEQLGGSKASAADTGMARAIGDYRQQALFTPAPAPAVSAVPARDPQRPGPAIDSPAAFHRELRPLAEAAAQKLGFAPEVLLAQAALETGWGRFVAADQRGSSNNLFNIKAGADWQGPTVTVQTLEYRDGIAEREQATFRAYASPADSFDDYVKLISESPRYQGARETAANPEAYLRGLQRAGYATDPAYADKVLGILARDDAPWAAGGLKSSPPRPLTAEGPTVASSTVQGQVQGQVQGLVQGLIQGQGW